MRVLKSDFQQFPAVAGINPLLGGVEGQKQGIDKPYYNRALADLAITAPDEYVELTSLPPKEIFAHLLKQRLGQLICCRSKHMIITARNQ